MRSSAIRTGIVQSGAVRRGWPLIPGRGPTWYRCPRVTAKGTRWTPRNWTRHSANDSSDMTLFGNYEPYFVLAVALGTMTWIGSAVSRRDRRIRERLDADRRAEEMWR